MTKSKKARQLVHLRLDRDVYDALVRAADGRKTPVSEFVRDAVVAAIGLCPTCGHDHSRSNRRRVVRGQKQAHDTRAAA